MENTVKQASSIERVEYADGSVGLRYLSPKRILWLGLFIIVGTPAGCTGGIATAVGLFGSGHGAGGGTLLLGLALLAFTAAMLVYVLRPTTRTLVTVPGQGVHTAEGNLPFKDIEDLVIKGGAAKQAAGLYALTKGREVLLAHCKTSLIAEQVAVLLRAEQVAAHIRAMPVGTAS